MERKAQGKDRAKRNLERQKDIREKTRKEDWGKQEEGSRN